MSKDKHKSVSQSARRRRNKRRRADEGDALEVLEYLLHGIHKTPDVQGGIQKFFNQYTRSSCSLWKCFKLLRFHGYTNLWILSQIECQMARFIEDYEFMADQDGTVYPGVVSKIRKIKNEVLKKQQRKKKKKKEKKINCQSGYHKTCHRTSGVTEPVDWDKLIAVIHEIKDGTYNDNGDDDQTVAVKLID